MKTKRTLILVSGILYVLGAVGALISAIAIIALMNPVVLPLLEEGARLTYEEMAAAGEILATDIDALVATEMLAYQIGLYITVAISVVGGIINAVVGGLLIAHSRKSDEIVATKKGIVITGLVFAILNSNVLLLILLICALVQKVDQVQAKPVEVTATVNSAEPSVATENVQPAQAEVVDEGAVEVRIKKLQALRDNGSITQAEYVELLKKIFND